MKSTDTPSYFRYWGKDERNGEQHHLPPYHLLDVAAAGGQRRQMQVGGG